MKARTIERKRTGDDIENTSSCALPRQCRGDMSLWRLRVGNRDSRSSLYSLETQQRWSKMNPSVPHRQTFGLSLYTRPKTKAPCRAARVSIESPSRCGYVSSRALHCRVCKHQEHDGAPYHQMRSCRARTRVRDIHRFEMNMNIRYQYHMGACVKISMCVKEQILILSENQYAHARYAFSTPRVCGHDTRRNAAQMYARTLDR